MIREFGLGSSVRQRKVSAQKSESKVFFGDVCGSCLLSLGHAKCGNLSNILDMYTSRAVLYIENRGRKLLSTVFYLLI